MALHEITPGVFTDSEQEAEEARREIDLAREYAEAYAAGDWPRWDEEEGKWDL